MGLRLRLRLDAKVIGRVSLLRLMYLLLGLFRLQLLRLLLLLVHGGRTSWTLSRRHISILAGCRFRLLLLLTLRWQPLGCLQRGLLLLLSHRDHTG